MSREPVRLAILWLAAGALALLALPAASATARGSLSLPQYRDPTETLSKYTIESLPTSGGYSAAFLAANDSGQAVGVEQDGSTEIPIYYSDGTVQNLQPQLGNGYLDAISPLDYAVGQSNGHPVFYGPGSTPITLPFSGTANAIALGAGPLVGVTNTSGSLPLAELWNPVTGGVLQLGNAQIGGVNVAGWAVGQSDSGHAWYAFPGPGGSVTEYSLSFKGYLRGINDYNWAYGYAIEHGEPEPLEVDFTGPATHSVTYFDLTPHFKLGTVIGINDAGFAVGEEYKDLSAFKRDFGVPIIWPYGPLHPLIADSALHLPHDVKLDDLDYATDNSFLIGGARYGKRERAIVLLPHPYQKLDSIEAILFFEGSLGDATDDLINETISQIKEDLDYDDDDGDDDACTGIDTLGAQLDDNADILDAYFGDDAAEEVATYDAVLGVLGEAYDEIDCDGTFSDPLLQLLDQQSPFYNTDLAGDSSTTVTTTVGPPVISSP